MTFIEHIRADFQALFFTQGGKELRGNQKLTLAAIFLIHFESNWIDISQGCIEDHLAIASVRFSTW